MDILTKWKRRSQRKLLYKEYLDLVGKEDRISVVKAMELTVLLDALDIHKHEKFIPANSLYIPCVKRGTMTPVTYILAFTNGREYTINPMRGISIEPKGIRLKCAKTGLIQPISN